MPAYTFETLSPYDLEILARDLLQAELGVRLESFTTGRDRGIDLRFAEDKANALIVQCKHYARSNWGGLRRDLLADVPKIQALGPQRYIVVTTLPLTPDRKEWICQTFAPYCRGPGDIFGPEDLNNLLGRHPDVERRHYKLWLTSVAILERILSSEVFSEQYSELEHIKRRITLFVSNPSVDRALQILTDHHFCVVTGVPGIGKTTLAEMLVIDHLNRGFECFRIWDDIGDARRVFGIGKNQLFYYDDFLGKTGLRQPDKNEDERLLRFIHDVVHSAHHRLLLTTRDYILNQARSILEGFSRADLDPARSVLSLADYTPLIRAEILYNHLYYSGMPREHLDAVVNARAYIPIVRHRNYSPRIIEAMTDVVNVREIAAKDYPAAFLTNLDNPQRLWEIAYNTHLTHAAQNALLVVASLPDEVRIADAEEAFEAFHRPRCAKYGQPGTPYDWKRALKELDSTFLAIGPSHGSITIRFHNPSVRDFIENHLRKNPRDVEEVIAAAVFPDQLTRIGRILTSVPDHSWVLPCAGRFLQIFGHRSSRAGLLTVGSTTVWLTRAESPILRFIELAQIAAYDPQGQTAEVMRAGTRHVLEHLESPAPNRAELTRLLNGILEGKIPHVGPTDEIFKAGYERAYAALDSPTIELDEYEALVDFADEHPDLVSHDARSSLATHFGLFADRELDILDQLEPDSRINTYDELAEIAKRLGLELSISRDAILEGIEYWPDDEGESRLGGRDAGGGISDGDLDSMFDSLKR